MTIENLDNRNTNGLRARTPDLLTVTEAATQLRVSRWMIFRLIQSRELRTITIGTRRLVPSQDLADFVARRRAEESAS